MRRHAPLLSVLLLVSATGAAAPSSGPRACLGADLVVVAGDTVDAEMACEGGRRALSFLANLGLGLPAELSVEVVDELPTLYGAEQLGSFDANTRRILVLSYAKCDEIGHEDLLFDQPLSLQLYRSLVAHEVAHAVFTANDVGQGSRIAAQEYIAYTTQFFAMSPDLRERILDASDISAFDDDAQMSPVRYLVSPQAFGIAAYRHFVNHPAGRDFVRRLLRGEVGTGSPYAY